MAEEQDDSQKTEDPTAKRLSEARNEGNLPISRDFSTWILLLGIVITAVALLPTTISQMMGPLTAVVEKSGEIRLGEGSFFNAMEQIFGAFSIPLLSITILLMIMGVLGWVLQTGLIFNMGLFKLKWERLNPVEGVKRLFSMQSLVELIKSVAKIVVVGAIAYMILEPIFIRSEGLTGMNNGQLVTTTYELCLHLLFAVFLTFTAIAAADFFYQRFTYFKNLRMTKSEVKEEFRQTEGDPHVKSRLRQIRTEKARKRMMAAVPKADVVITNPTHFAIALKYESGLMQAPVVIAKGQDFVAQKIREVAEAHKVPLVSNPPLARALYASVEIDEEIPPQHYRAVAEIISFIYKLKKAKG
jgi:flagellar biosynthetic protein FlhB